MSSIERDGLCGVIYQNARSDLQIRCSHYFGHEGKHSWDREDIVSRFTISSTGMGRDRGDWAKRFLDLWRERK